MFYYAVNLHGVPTVAKTELTSRFQWVPEYYFGPNVDGTGGADHLADHHIFIRANDVDTFATTLMKIQEEHKCKIVVHKIEEDFIPFDRMHGIDRIFEKQYADTTVKPVPYTYTPIEERFPEE